MGKKGKRRKIGPASPQAIAAFKEGRAIAVSRPNAIARLLDAAIQLWALEQDPVPTHVLCMAAYQCLEDIGKPLGKAPKMKTHIGAETFTAAYDYLRHSSADANTHMSLPVSANSFVIFDAVLAFDRIFDRMSPDMRAFQVCFILFGNRDYKAREHLRSRVVDILPKDLTVGELEPLTCREAFIKLREFFESRRRD